MIEGKNYKTALTKSINFFGRSEFGVEIESFGKNTKNPPYNLLANFITEILGEYCYTTVRNECPVSVWTAINNKYLFMDKGRPRLMDSESLYEMVLKVFPEIDVADLAAIKAKKEELLKSNNIYPFFKYDAVPMNVYNRLRKGGVFKFLNNNINAFKKEKNSHLFGEEDKTRAYLYNTFVYLKELWETNRVPNLISNVQ